MKIKKVMTKKKKIKVFIMFLTIFTTAITLIVGTYSWFSGISTVNTSQFNVAISSGDGLQLSLDGTNWTKNTLNISKNAIENAYDGNTNKWTDSLVPVSTIGELNTSVSRIKLYDKQSLTPTSGGYRIVANQIDNYTNTEANGYIVFDLFIKNGSGDAYESSSYGEDIFLSGNSNVSVPISGTTPNYGAANSIRVGFFRIGYIKTKNTSQNIQSVTCSTSGDCNWGPTGIDGGHIGTRHTYQWNIWEPNANKHTENLTSYYNRVCKIRDNTNGYTADPCIPLETGVHKLTYSIKDNIVSDDEVDIYDGVNNNGYSDSSTKLASIDTYKTTDATTTGLSKPRLIQLPGNSTAKVRVYIWLEGQDVDNYDLITKNTSLNINFGFTKDRLGIDTTNNSQITGRTSTFEDDSWETIKTNVQAGQTSQYHIGDTRQVRIGNNEYTVRLANKSKDSMCNTDAYSKTACGFVVEFVDVVTTMKMRDTATNVGGYPATNVYTYLNNTLYNQLPSDLQSVIVNTKVVSGYGNNGTDSSNFITTNKLYLLSSKEVYGTDAGGNDFYDTAYQLTNQLEYYSTNGVTYTTNGYTGTNQNKVIKQNNGSNSNWWLRSAYSYANYYFANVHNDGNWRRITASNTGGVSPAFRIG